ncbi:ABC transporter ATP-binding protein [Roseomonas sp. BN140053]|uniref:ABC transporter ATP-binding protein n=1 Tax=Roseomonas sp. BN140053 TaxID=3391898 RepID=UPI0039EAE48D
MTAEPVLQVRGLSKRFGALAVARAVDLDLAPGARLGLIGPNGAGKTTLINLLTGTLRADAGTVRLDGEEIGGLAPESRVHRGLVRTHQLNTLLPENTVADNVAVAIAERDRLAWRMFRYGAAWRRCCEEAQSWLAAVGLAGAGAQAVSRLPYGQQRLLEIAIALALRPRVLLLDEPAAGVPSGEAHAIHAITEQLPADIAVVMIEHDMDLVFRFAREITVLVAGAVLTSGPPAAIAADPEVRAVYLGRQAA